MRSTKIRIILHVLIAFLPLRLKLFCYRVFFKYRIGKRVRIGLTVLDVMNCEIADDVAIGHGNVIVQVETLSIGTRASIGYLNLIRGGTLVTVGSYANIRRMNEINAITNPRVTNPLDPSFVLGSGSVVTSGHKIDYTDKVEIGCMSVLGGRNSSLWTHSRQQTSPITVGSWTYLGSEIRMAPGSSIPSRCILGIGSVVVSQLDEEETLIGGVPAKVIRRLDDRDLALLDWQWRPDLPPELTYDASARNGRTSHGA